MKMYLISDNIDTQAGMRLAGIDGCVMHTAEEIRPKIESLVQDKELGILVMTEKAAAAVREYIDELKLRLEYPLIIEIPDRHGSRDIAESINKMVQESIGLKI